MPPDLVYGNPDFLRPCRSVDGRRRERFLSFYAADMMRGPDGVWRVLADRTGQAQGLAYALENRRILARVVPELFQSQKIRQLRPFLEVTGDALQALCPDDGAGVALLSGGHSDPLWFEHVLLSREMSIGLVESGDLTLRNGQVFLKTLRGLQRIGVLLRRKEGTGVDPLELSPGGGVPGLLEAIRGGCGAHGQRSRFGPGRGAWPRRLPAVAVPPAAGRGPANAQPGDAVAGRRRGGADRAARPRRLADPQGDRRQLAARSCRCCCPARNAPNWRHAWRPIRPTMPSRRRPSLSVAPCVGPLGLEPKPIALRMFLSFDGTEWRAFPGGLARALSEEDALAGRLPRNALSKDVWVIAEEHAGIQGALGIMTPILPIRRTAGDLPSRVADNFYWLGRYLERLEEAARLQRAMIARILRPSPTPREIAEMQILIASLTSVGMMDRGRRQRAGRRHAGDRPSCAPSATMAGCAGCWPTSRGRSSSCATA